MENTDKLPNFNERQKLLDQEIATFLAKIYEVVKTEFDRHFKKEQEVDLNYFTKDKMEYKKQNVIWVRTGKHQAYYITYLNGCITLSHEERSTFMKKYLTIKNFNERFPIDFKNLIVRR